MIILDFGLVLSSVPDGRPFGMDSQTIVQIVANLINVGVLAFILAFLLYRPIRGILRKRADKIEGQLQHAEDEIAKAEKLRLQYEKKMDEVQRERDIILSDTRKNATETGQRLIAEAKKEADAIRARATANIELEWERAESEMRTAIIEVSSVMAEKFVTLAINKKTHDRLFDDTMADLEGIKWRS